MSVAELRDHGKLALTSAYCSEIDAPLRRLVSRYPFVRDARDELGLDEFTAFFHPETGALRRFRDSQLGALITVHGLDIAAVLVLAGCGWFLWRRFRNREATTGERFGYDFFPLIGLVAISVTGLLLTFSSWLLEGRSYDFLAIAHMATVVLTLVFIPFGKFFHVIQRPASVGVEIYKRAALERDGVFPCRRCGQPLEAKAFVGDLKKTMDELELGFSAWAETCPRCKRVLRGQAYLDTVKKGFK